MNKAFLIGKKIYLRGLEEDDLENIQRWLLDNDVTRLLFQGDRPLNLRLMQDEFNKKIHDNNEIVFAIVTRASNLHIGWAGLYEINWISRNSEMRFFIGEKKFWGKGFTTEVVRLLIDYAFNKLNLHKVYGGANKENHGSVKIFRKLGFTDEGISKEGHFRNGRYYDLVRFGLINKKNN